MLWRFPHASFRFFQGKNSHRPYRNAASPLIHGKIHGFCCLLRIGSSKIHHYFHALHHQLLEAEQLAEYA